ncbi:cytidine deaminase [Hydrogenibacillus schlegelii]
MRKETSSEGQNPADRRPSGREDRPVGPEDGSREAGELPSGPKARSPDRGDLPEARWIREAPPAAWAEAARSARDRAYVPYSGFAVGALVVTTDGRAFFGANVENAAYPASICAERVALVKAATEGETPPAALIVVADSAEPVTPCGVCRQVMAELCPPEMPVYLGNLAGDWIRTTVTALLPGAFGKEALSGHGGRAE